MTIPVRPSAETFAFEAERSVIATLEAWGWRVEASPDRLLDAIVHAPADGECPALTFGVEVKAARDVALAAPKAQVSARVLRRLARHHLPVVIVLSTSHGVAFWETVRTTVARLDRMGVGWRDREVVQLDFPISQRFDGACDELRQRVQHESAGLRGTANAPSSIEAPSAIAGALDLALVQEPSIALESFHRQGSARVELTAVESPRFVFQLRRPAAGTSVEAVVELRVELTASQVDEHTVQLSTPSDAPTAIQIVADQRQPLFRLSVKRRSRERSISAEVESLRFVVGFTRGGVLRIFDEKDGQTLLKDTPVQGSAEHLAQLEYELAAFEQLAFVQTRLAELGRLPRPFLLPETLTAEIAKDIAELAEIVGGGERRTRATLVATLHNIRNRAKAEGKLEFLLTAGKMHLLGVDVPIGSVRVHVVDSAAAFAGIEAAKARTDARLELRDIEVVERYLDWQPSPVWERVAEFASGQGGYLLASQAEALGFDGVDVEAAVANRLLERMDDQDVEDELLHLTRMPHAADPGLVRAWLWSGCEGVFSHETALAQWNLSDVSPNKIYMTVPPRERAEPPPNVVVHAGLVPKNERAWLDDLPFTSPLRTIRDCRAASVAEDLLQQAAREGVARGMFTAADVDAGRAAE